MQAAVHGVILISNSRGWLRTRAGGVRRRVCFAVGGGLFPGCSAVVVPGNDNSSRDIVFVIVMSAVLVGIGVV